MQSRPLVPLLFAFATKIRMVHSPDLAEAFCGFSGDATLIPAEDNYCLARARCLGNEFLAPTANAHETVALQTDNDRCQVSAIGVRR